MTQRPSKQFIIRGTFAVAVVALVLGVQTTWFRALLHRKAFPSPAPTETVGDLVSKDSNRNGIADWEERLWGLDPTVLYTNGTPNKALIEEKKKSLGIQATTAPANETDALAQDLLTITTALGQSGEVSDENLSAVATKLADSIEFNNVSNHYSLKDMQTVRTTNASLKTYYRAVGAVSATYAPEQSELALLVETVQTGAGGDIKRLQEMRERYARFAQALISTPTPVGIENLHLHMTNAVYGISVSLQYLSELNDNGANAIVGIALYKLYDQQLSATLSEIQEYLTRYGIL